MPAPPSPLSRDMRLLLSSTAGARRSPGASSGSGSGSGNSSRKRVRENNAVANGDAAEALMRDAGPEEDDEYFDVDMEAQEAYDEMEAATRDRPQNQETQKSDDALFVPYYAHFGASDFDDEYVVTPIR